MDSARFAMSWFLRLEDKEPMQGEKQTDLLASRARYPYLPHHQFGVVGNQVRGVPGRPGMRAFGKSHEPVLAAPIPSQSEYGAYFLRRQMTWHRA
jgi:hypothetical protein